MKTAILFYGHMRTFDRCFKSVRDNVIVPLNADVFIHTWDEIEARTKTWHSRSMNVRPISEKERLLINNMFQPTDMLIEHQPATDDNCTTPNNKISVSGQKFMLHSLKQACLLKQKHEQSGGFQYDVVVKIRPDIQVLSPLTFDIPISPNDVFVVGRKHSKPPEVRSYSACDIINVATSSTMDRICCVVDHFDQFYIDNVNAGKLWHSGYIDFIRSLGLNIRMMSDCNWGKNWVIVRK